MNKPEQLIQLDMWDAANKLHGDNEVKPPEDNISCYIDILFELVAPYFDVRILALNKFTCK